jgi:hypothetical protein
VWRELRWSAAGFALGIGAYWLSVRYMSRLGIVAAETQTIVWFAVTIVDVAVVSGKFTEWPLPDRLVEVAVALGLGWLPVRLRALTAHPHNQAVSDRTYGRRERAGEPNT